MTELEIEDYIVGRLLDQANELAFSRLGRPLAERLGWCKNEDGDWETGAIANPFDDAKGEALLGGWEHYCKYDPAKSQLDIWSYVKLGMQNQLQNVGRKRYRRALKHVVVDRDGNNQQDLAELAHETRVLEAPDDAIAREAMDEFWMLVNGPEFTPRQREVIDAYFACDGNRTAIRKRLDIKPPTLTRHLSAIMGKLPGVFHCLFENPKLCPVKSRAVSLVSPHEKPSENGSRYLLPFSKSPQPCWVNRTDASESDRDPRREAQRDTPHSCRIEKPAV